MHLHTTFSDGKYDPEVLIDFAHKSYIRFLSITDHDTTASLQETAQACEQKGISFIPGIELSTVYEGVEIHILGYNFDPHNASLQTEIKKMRNYRLQRAKTIIERLNKLGIEVQLSEVLDVAGSCDNIGRPHIALLLKEKGYVKTIAEAFIKYLDPGRPGYVERYKLKPSEAIELIVNAGGIPVYAHPGINFSKNVFDTVLNMDIAGIEVFHPSHSREVCSFLSNTAQKRKLIITGGSDFHGHETHDFSNLGAMNVPYATIEKLFQDVIR